MSTVNWLLWQLHSITPAFLMHGAGDKFNTKLICHQISQAGVRNDANNDLSDEFKTWTRDNWPNW